MGAAKRITLLGATGSIGTSCQDVVRSSGGQLQFDTLVAHSRWKELAQACYEFRPQYAVLTGVTAADLPADAFPAETKLLFGMEAVAERSASPDSDVVVSAIVGAAGLHGTWAAVRCGKNVALANKETLVVAGPLVMQACAKSGSQLIPVDSEHSAIFQALQCGRRAEVSRLILTASGGPFRTRSKSELTNVTAADALDHPTWNMGPKITIDSATMMNKALEVIEARWLFGFPAEQIDVVVHPQSIVHSLVEFVDGSVLAQMSPPDMRLPVQYALSWPDRWVGISPRLDLTRSMSLTFEPPDLDRFPALGLGFEVARQGGTAGAVLNAANEVAVSRFLRGELSFLEIERLNRSILSAHEFEASPSLEEVLAADDWARQEAQHWTPLSSPLHSPSLIR